MNAVAPFAAAAPGQLSILNLITQATWTVKAVMLLLLLASLASWTMIFWKWARMRAAQRAVGRFEDRFWKEKDMRELYQEAIADPEMESGNGAIFRAGYKEFVRLRQQVGSQATEALDAARRAMRVALMREVESLESNLAFLATVGSVSPFIGLFGTVWGIMHAFTAIGVAQQATLATVAPAIAEALIATAAGLFAAIPAAVAYNYFTHDLDRLNARYEAFMEEFSNILNRQTQETRA
ncbi:MAG: protein TolQ [Pseudomonadota bacterium]|nr:protein TolQ [Thermithiobacillus tepidarius]